MPIARYILLACVSALLVGMVACTQQPPPTKQKVLTSLADDLIVPRFQQVAQEMEDLNAALSALCSNGGSSELEAARSAWRDAREPWIRSQAMWFGPVMDRRSRSLVDWWPVDPDRIEKLLSDRGYHRHQRRARILCFHPAWAGSHRIRAVRRRSSRTGKTGRVERNTVPIPRSPGRCDSR